MGYGLSEPLLFILTLGIGYIAWSPFIWGQGRTPAQRILNLPCWLPEDCRVAGRDEMAIRQVLGFFLCGGLIWGFFVCLFSNNLRSAGDLLAGSVVLHDPGGVLVLSAAASGEVCGSSPCSPQLAEGFTLGGGYLFTFRPGPAAATAARPGPGQTSPEEAGDLAALAFRTVRPSQPEWLELSRRCLAVLCRTQRATEAIAVADSILARVDDADLIGQVETDAARAPWLGGRISDLLARTERALIGAGHTNRSAASELGVSINTVGTHLRAVFAKLGIQSRVQLANLLHKQSAG